MNISFDAIVFYQRSYFNIINNIICRIGNPTQTDSGFFADLDFKDSHGCGLQFRINPLIYLLIFSLHEVLCF